MELRLITDGGVEERGVEEVPKLLKDERVATSVC
jgi:hypothetical protein